MKNKVSLRVNNSMAKRLFYHFRVTNSRLKNKNFHFELLAWSWKIKSLFRVTNLKLKYNRWLNFNFPTFELLTQTWKIWNFTSSYKSNPGWYSKFNSTSVPYHLRVIKRKLVYSFNYQLNQIIFTLYSVTVLNFEFVSY